MFIDLSTCQSFSIYLIKLSKLLKIIAFCLIFSANSRFPAGWFQMVTHYNVLYLSTNCNLFFFYHKAIFCERMTHRYDSKKFCIFQGIILFNILKTLFFISLIFSKHCRQIWYLKYESIKTQRGSMALWGPHSMFMAETDLSDLSFLGHSVIWLCDF